MKNFKIIAFILTYSVTCIIVGYVFRDFWSRSNQPDSDPFHGIVIYHNDVNDKITLPIDTTIDLTTLKDYTIFLVNKGDVEMSAANYGGEYQLRKGSDLICEGY